MVGHLKESDDITNKVLLFVHVDFLCSFLRNSKTFTSLESKK